MFDFWGHKARARERHRIASEAAPAPTTNWLSAWLCWLDGLQEAEGRRTFPEDPELRGLYRMWDAGATIEDAQRWLNEGAPRG